MDFSSNCDILDKASQNSEIVIVISNDNQEFERESAIENSILQINSVVNTGKALIIIYTFKHAQDYWKYPNFHDSVNILLNKINFLT